MRWFRRAPRADAAPRRAEAGTEADEEALAARGVSLDELADEPFVCPTCGRTDLPPAGDWDPPICSECDAAINFDALLEADAFEDDR